jgi:DNA invertase Pin-like site-specific DNA recombinase
MEDIDTIISQTNNLNINQESIIYNRISSKNQKDGMSLDNQSDINRQYCIENHLIVKDEIFETASAYDSNQKQVELVNIINNSFNINIICLEPTRFSRNIKNTGEWFEIMGKNNINLICTNPLLISNNMVDKGKILLLVLHGENESKIKSERQIRTIRNKKRIGNYFPSIPKFGSSYFKISKNNVKIISNKKECLILTLIKKLYYGGKVKDINQILFEITGDNKHFIYDMDSPDDKLKEIQHGNMCIIDIVNFLNCSEIKRRNKYWNHKSVSDLIKNLNSP